MQAPDFWSDAADERSALLAPLGCVYAGAGRLWRRLTVPLRAGIPVVCIGNLVAGGAGKTPVALSLAGRLNQRPSFAGRVHCLIRGYGGSERGPLRVDAARHDARQIGDEALLLAVAAPTWVARDRRAGARAAAAAGAAVLIMDDGLQNPTLHQDLALVVIDGGYGFGNGRIIPAGPLREPVADGLARAHGVVLIGEDRAGVTARLGALPLLQAQLVPTPASAAALAGRRVLAFAGIGRPCKFFDSLRALGCTLAETRPFADHHPYNRDDIEGLLAAAARLDALPVTTTKDRVRLPADLRQRVAVLEIEIAWQDAAALDRLIERHITQPPAMAAS